MNENISFTLWWFKLYFELQLKYTFCFYIQYAIYKKIIEHALTIKISKSIRIVLIYVKTINLELINLICLVVLL